MTTLQDIERDKGSLPVRKLVYLEAGWIGDKEEEVAFAQKLADNQVSCFPLIFLFSSSCFFHFGFCFFSSFAWAKFPDEPTKI